MVNDGTDSAILLFILLGKRVQCFGIAMSVFCSCILFSSHSSVRTVYVLILPFALIELGHLMPVAVTVTAWALLSIEDGCWTSLKPLRLFSQHKDCETSQPPAIQVI